MDGMGIIMDPYSGAILAMASRPSYDPNLPETRVGDALKNKVLYELIEPGSTFKIVTASAGIEQGGITKDTIIDCEGGSTQVGRKVIRDVHKMGAVPFWKCFEQSSNVAMVKVGKKVGLDTLREYVKKFGFGTKTLEDISTERIGAISTNRAETTLSSMSIGYAVMVTPIQLARAYLLLQRRLSGKTFYCRKSSSSRW
jgi:cell division protein FtsI (penicillin-binding protein 3)